jgi:nitrogen fixation NifU-like protein
LTHWASSLYDIQTYSRQAGSGMTQTDDSTMASGPVLFYTDILIEHFTNPRNVGEFAAADCNAYACVGDPGCGDELKLWLRIESNTISDIRFKSFGCPAAIATSSMLSTLAKGRPLTEALALTDDDVVQALGGLAENKQHCSLLGVQALHQAVAAWQQKKEMEQ